MVQCVKEEKVMSLRKIIFTTVFVLVLSLAALSAFANTPFGEDVVQAIYLPIVSKIPAGGGTLP